MLNPLAADLDHILAHTRDLWPEFENQRLFITGGTGFFGCWLLESFLWAVEKLRLNATATVLTRNPDAFRAKASHLANHPMIEMWRGDVRSFECPAGKFGYVIHAATESSTQLNAQNPLAMLDTVIEGTRRTLDFAVQCGARKFLLTSSGAVYGEQPEGLAAIPETYAGAPDTTNPASAYGEGKRVAELLCAIYHSRYGLETKIARCFAFVGPYLPLDAHFAIGNFIRDRLQGGPIRVQSDGRSLRSYLYAADLAIWLLKILMRGSSNEPYNVGSSAAISIGEAARLVAASETSVSFSDAVGIQGNANARRYVPETMMAHAELHLDTWIGLDAAVERTVRWHKTRNTAW